MALNVKFVDNTDIILNKVAANFDETAATLGTELVEMVQENMLYGYHDPHGPDRHTEIVDTGALFDSIQSDVQRQSQNLVEISVGSDMPYAVYVHNGTRKLKARRFITDAISKHMEAIRQLITSGVGKGF